MKVFIKIGCAALATGLAFLVLDSIEARGPRGGGGGGARGGGGGGRVGGGGGGMSRPSGGGVSRPSGGGVSRPSGGSINRTPSFSTPKISNPVSRPSVGGGKSGPALGGGGVGNRQPGQIQMPAQRPGPSVGTRPSIQPKSGIGSGVVGKGGPGIDKGIGGGKNPFDPKSGIGSGIAGKGGVGIDKGIAGKGPANLPSTRPGTLPGQRPSTLPGLGTAIGAGAIGAGLANRGDGVGRRHDLQGDRKENIQDRSKNLQDRMDSRQDFRGQSQDRRQDYRDNRREDWQNFYDDHYRHHDNWCHGHWSGNWGNYWGHMWSDHTAAMVFGTTMWGINRLAYGFGYYPYTNPYYSAPIVVDNSVINYSVPLSEPLASPAAPPVQGSELPPGVTKAGMDNFEAARTAFYEGNYQAALSSVNKALASMPNDAMMHEFRALVLFSLGQYEEAAAPLYSVLSVGPGWDWTTMSSLYPETDIYTQQLRKLERWVGDHPKSAAGHFVAAYHYMTGGHPEDAGGELKKVLKLMPGDALAKQLLQLTGQGEQVVDVAPPEPSGVKIDKGELVGSWTATRKDQATFELTLTKDGGFTWVFRQGKTRQEVKGAFAIDGSTLAMEPDSGGVMTAEITAPKNGTMSFRMVGGPANDPGLEFRKK